MAKRYIEIIKRTPVLLTFLILVIYLFFLGPIGFFDAPKLKTADVFTQLKVFFQPAPEVSKKIVFVTIDDQSFRIMGKRWPWGRDMFAAFLEKIKPLKPKLVCFDIAFYGESSNKEEDLKFAQAIRDSGNVILPSYIGEKNTYILPLSSFGQNALAVGFVNKPKDVDQAIRSTRITFSYGSGKFVDYSFETKIALAFLGAGSKKLYIPADKYGTLPINFTTNYAEFKAIPIWQVLQDKVKKEDIQDKIILIGTTSESFHDVHLTPLGSIPALGVLGNCLVMLLDKNYLRPVSGGMNLLIIVLFCLITALATYKLSAVKGLLLVSAELVIFIATALFLFWHNRQMDFFSPIFIILVTYLLVNAYKYVNLMMESATLRRLALTDELTGLFAFRYFQLRIQNEFDKAVHLRHDLSLLIIDIDHFKSFNDTYGHEQGNIVLKTTAKLIQDSCRKLDIAARYGGEEFCIILPSTEDKGAMECAERLRTMVERYDFPGQDKVLKVTVSIGAASLHHSQAQTATDLIKSADSALYKAKNSGRNKTCLFGN